MSHENYEEGCPGCKPALLDATTGRVLPEDHPIMKCVLRFWETTTTEERTAFHDVTCQNSRKESDMLTVQSLMKRMKAAMDN